LTFRTEVQRVQMPAKKARGRVSLRANQIGGRDPLGSTSFSEKLVNGTRQRLSTPSQRRQCGDATLWTLVTPGSLLRPFKAKTGDGMPHRASVSSRPSAVFRTIGVGEDAGQWWEISRPIEHGPRQLADRLLPLRNCIQVAHPHFPSAIRKAYQADDWTETGAFDPFTSG
jgi:hypothetical protein